ncbi:MAG: polyprenyl-pyrophosphate binding protein [Candidatus Entotheonella factor]|uniref:Polyprenyl-pyrophosphate binding protein n=1 Tax=Entotheonella factor TaxID=1429438 RepID=W4LV14_ENTF1|nr:YceI family protein [Candidatus Entotheonella palauensis]ETX01566.1 MAG: polyprenyl-pyrophosphate binding protein [Candidatus Entotheonella factor]
MRMKIVLGIVLSAMLIAGMGGTALAADKFKIDPSHTSATFRVLHQGYSYVAGRFNEIAGDVVFDENDYLKSQVNIVIKTESVDTNHKKRDDHLRSPDFFNAKEFPEMTFKSTGVEQTGDKAGKLMGDLTLLGVTKPVTLEVVFNRIAPNRKNIVIAGFSAKGSIKRTDFGMTYGLQGIGDEIDIHIEAEAHKQ